MTRMGWLAFSIVIFSAANASAQEELVHGDDAREVLVLRGESEEVTALYVSGISIFGTSVAMGVFGGLTLFSGDTLGPGFIPLFASPAVATIGLILLSIAVGYDIGVSRWNTARIRGDDRFAARSELSGAITLTYGVGLGVVAASLLSLIPIGVVDGFRTPIYLIPTVIGGLGLFTLLVGAGLDIAAGAWTGFDIALAPSPDGITGAVSGRF
jgi:hypothetical protein